MHQQNSPIADLGIHRPSYGADWGDYISFAQRLRERADQDGSDLLLIDTGDRIEGNGLYDAAHPKGKYILSIFGKQRMDVLCSGNHELYKNHSSYDEYRITVPQSHGHYLASNIDIIDPDTGDRKPLAQRYTRLTTKNQGIRILAFGFLYDFTLNSNNTIVQKVEDAIEEKWFQEAIRQQDVDLFLVIGHVPLRTPEFKLIFRAIRRQNWDTPIQFFGGHLHIRDFAKYDSRAYALESGRYMETIGFMSINGLNAGGKQNANYQSSALSEQPRHEVSLSPGPTFARRYIDNNLYSFYHHTGLNNDTFQTPEGLNVSATISKDRKALGLDKIYGCAPQDYWTSRAPFPDENSIFSWLQDKVLPDMLQQDGESDFPKLVLTNTGAIRFDIFEGPFTLDSMYTISPFTSGFRVIPKVPYKIASQILRLLNLGDPAIWSGMQNLAFKTPESTTGVDAQLNLDVVGAGSHQVPLFQHEQEDNLTPGYTTVDDAGSDGDDTKHSAIKFFKIPNCIESRVAFPQASAKFSEPDVEEVDLVYADFIERFVLVALKFLGTDYDQADTASFIEGQTLTSLIGEWVKQNWKC